MTDKLTREQIEELFERSKNDRAIIVGSEVRMLAVMALSALDSGWIKCSERLPTAEDGNEIGEVLQWWEGCKAPSAAYYASVVRSAKQDDPLPNHQWRRFPPPPKEQP